MASSLTELPALTLSSLHHHLRPPSSRTDPRSASFLLLRRPTSLNIPSTSSWRPVSPLKAAPHVDGAAAASPSVDGDGGRSLIGLAARLRLKIALLGAFFPGGSWWRLPQEDRGDWDQDGRKAVVVSVPFAFRRMWELLRDDKWIVFAGFTVLILAAVSEISIPNFLAASIFSAQSGDASAFDRNSRMMLLLCATGGICSGLRGLCFGIANMILVKRLREVLYSTLLFQDISFFDNETVGDLTSRLGSDCQQISRVIGNDLNLISRSIIQGTGALIYMLTLSWPLALSTLGICTSLATMLFFYGKYQKQAAKLVQQFTAGANEVAEETFSLVRTVRVYGTEKQEIERYKKWLQKLADVNLRQSAAHGFWSFSFSSLYHCTQVIALIVGAIFIRTNRISAEQLTKFILYCEWLIYSIWWFGDNWSNLMQSIGASEKVFQLMDLLPGRQFSLKGGVELNQLIGRVEFKNIHFHYPSRKQVPVLEDISFSAQPNEVVGIVGLSGSGKSTLVNLLLHLYEPTSGQILVDGHQLADLDVKWLRERIGFVGQEPRLFHMDVESNIKYGCTRDVTHEDVKSTAKQAFAHDFILALPDGYKTLVDNDLLSGGQKQRIAIARALLRDPAILIFDEATSALDAESEYYVTEVLRGVRDGSMGKRTCLVIAHRLSTIRVADRIVVMEGGRIVEMGNHLELLRRDGLYARLTKKQSDGMIAWKS